MNHQHWGFVQRAPRTLWEHAKYVGSYCLIVKKHRSAGGAKLCTTFIVLSKLAKKGLITAMTANRQQKSKDFVLLL